MAIFRQGPRRHGASNAWDRHTLRFWTNSSVRTTIDGLPRTSVSQLRCTSVYGTETATHQWIRRREENLFVGSGKSKAEVTNNRILRSTYCTTDRNNQRAASLRQQSFLLHRKMSAQRNYVTRNDIYPNLSDAWWFNAVAAIILIVISTVLWDGIRSVFRSV